MEQGQIVVLDGTVTGAEPDPHDADRVRLRIVRLLAGVGRQPDEHEVIVSVPREMKIATAAPVDEADLPAPRPES